MKHTSLLAISLLFILSACSSLQPIPTFTPTIVSLPTSVHTPTIPPVPTISTVDAATSVQFFPQVYTEDIISHSLISPSGEKIILDHSYVNGMPYKEKSSFTLPIFGTGNDPQVRNVEIQLDIPSTFYYVKAWAPDEKAFAAIFYDYKYFNGSETCCGEAIAITNLEGEKAETYTYHWGWNHSSQLTWSEDSSMLSVNFSGDYTPLIFNKSGELVKTFPQTTTPLFWSKNNLYFTEKKDDKIQLRWYDFDTQTSNLIADDVKGATYVSHNNMQGQILFTEYTPTGGFSAENKFYVTTFSSGFSKGLLPINLLTYRWTTSPTQDFVAFQGRDGSLWILTWGTWKFQYYGQIKNLFGWYKNTDGFLVTSLDGKQKIIKP